MHPALNRFMTGETLIQHNHITDDFAQRINAIRIQDTPPDDDGSGTLAKATTRQLRLFVLEANQPHAPAANVAHPTLPKAFWSKFWKMDMLHKVRNI